MQSPIDTERTSLERQLNILKAAHLQLHHIHTHLQKSVRDAQAVITAANKALYEVGHDRQLPLSIGDCHPGNEGLTRGELKGLAGNGTS